MHQTPWPPTFKISISSIKSRPTSQCTFLVIRLISRLCQLGNIANHTQPHLHDPSFLILLGEIKVKPKVLEMHHAFIPLHTYSHLIQIHLKTSPNHHPAFSSTPTPLWLPCTVAAPSYLSPSVWREKERSIVKKIAHKLNKVLQPHPLSLADQGTSWTPLTLTTVLTNQP
jgi:hypothetical protein